MKRFISALAFCLSLLVLLSIFLFPPVKAREDPIAILLSLPAPPPPNPLVSRSAVDPSRYRNAPPDDAPIADLIAYWSSRPASYHGRLNYGVPSDRTVERLTSEMLTKPALATSLLKVLPDDDRSIAAVKALYDRAKTDRNIEPDQRSELRDWLRLNSSYLSDDLARVSETIRDEGSYVASGYQDGLLALTRHDYAKAAPIIDRLYLESGQPASKTLATWARYRHAIETDSIGDVERYRTELMQMVADRTLPDGARDMANDALTQGPDFPGRAEWNFSLFEDETLVNMPNYTMLTTLITYTPPEMYASKMIELLEKTTNPIVRTAAARNLIVALEANPEQDVERQIVKSLLPAIEDPKWLNSDLGLFGRGSMRAVVIGRLSKYEMPESVPGLIKSLDEKEKRSMTVYLPAPAANLPGNTRVLGNPSSNANVDVRRTVIETDVFPLRSAAVLALATQKDPRAVPSLRRILLQAEQYERGSVVKALLACGGFSVSEQLDALDIAAKGVRAEIDATVANMNPASNFLYAQRLVNSSGYVHFGGPRAVPGQMSGDEVKMLLAQQLLQASEISDELARAVVDRIEDLEKKDPATAAAYRHMIMKWQNAAINLLLLSDVKRGLADTDTIVRLLSERKVLREKQPLDISDVRNGNASAIGIAACLVEDPNDYVAILEGGNAESKIAMLACARLIRAPLPVAKVAENLSAQTPALVIAAERYLESEDSPEARAFVLARHPGEAKILGATSTFTVEGAGDASSEYLWALYQSVGDSSLYNGWRGSGNDDELKTIEKTVQAEVKKDDALLGIYAYDKNYIRIYKDRVIFSWDEDESRYRERPMSKYEFDYIKSYLTDNKADELPPFLACGGDYCTAKELVMVGRNGGRRVYTSGESDFFTGLDKYFADLKLSPAKPKYGLSREIPGLEIILASDELHVSTVWKNGDDLRVCASQTAVRKKVKEEIEKIDGDSDAETDENADADAETKKAAETEKRQWEGYAWYRITNSDAAPAAQPPDVEFIPPHDALAVPPDTQAWKTRAAGSEIRTSTDGLFKAVGGKLTKLRPGNYSYPVVTPSGRWGLAYKMSGENGGEVVRVDFVTNREYPVAIEGYGQKYPQAYVPTLGKFLVVRKENDYEDDSTDTGKEDDATPADDDQANIMLVDPANGMVFPATSGELRPLTQQSFRPLQKAVQPDEYWAAMPDAEKNETRIGIYNTKWLTFKAVRAIPKIKFNSMDMWVDEPAAKIYFVYRGHLLALPLTAVKN